jgi:hypothetical protein
MIINSVTLGYSEPVTQEESWFLLSVGEAPPTPVPPIPDSPVTFSKIFVIAKNLIRLEFTGSVATTSALFDPDTYIVTGGNASVIGTVPSNREDAGGSVTEILLEIAQTQFESTYVLSIADDVLREVDGSNIKAVSLSWDQVETKVDSVLQALPQQYATEVGSVFRTILEGIMISDEEIGGSY